MHFSNAAVLVLGALQSALGKPTLLHRAGDGTQNGIQDQWLTATETVLHFRAPNPGCGDTRAWVGVWPVDACNPYWADFKAWQYVEPTKADYLSIVKFNNTELGIGEYKAAFVCEDGKRSPWMVSKAFEIDAAPRELEGKCRHRTSRQNTTWIYTKCDEVKGLCYDDAFTGGSDRCSDCPAQCGFPDDEFQ